MEYKRENNYVFIDFQNLVRGVEELGWEIDFGLFFKYLKSKHRVTRVFCFIGYLMKNEQFYLHLKDMGYEIVFKEIQYKDGKLKGNVDVDLAVTVMVYINEFDKAIIVSGDGDFKILVDLLIEKEKFKIALVPSIKHCSALIKRAVRGRLAPISDLRGIIAKKEIVNEKGLHGDAPA